MSRLQEIETRKLEIRSLVESDQEINVEEVEAELRTLNDEKQGIEKREQIAKGIQAGVVPTQEVQKPKEERTMEFNVLTKEEILSAPEFRSAFLKKLQGKAISEVEQRALTSASNSAGGAIPTVTLNQIVDKLRQFSVLYPRVKVSFVAGNISVAVANAKNASAWKTEGANGTAADDTIASVSLSGYELIKLVEISATVQSMAVDAFEAYITDEIGRQMSIAIENAIVNGSGSGQPTGILSGITWGSGNSVTWASNASVAYDQLVDGLALLPTLYHPNAVFVMNRKMLFSGIRKIKTTTGEPIFTYNAQDSAASSILGYPVLVNDYAPDDTILIGDLNYYYINFAKAPEISVSMEAGFASGKITYRGLAVADGKPALAEAFVKISKATA
jgi:HK97 family phage major capsid protein